MAKTKYKLQTTKPKIWKRKGKLTKKAKAYLSYKLHQYWKEKKAEEPIEEIEEVAEEEEIVALPYHKYTYSIKLMYESSRGSNFDNLIECNLIVIAPREPSKDEIEQMVLDNMEKMAEELGQDFILNIPYTEVVVGLIDTSSTNEDADDFYFTEVKYSHNLGRGERKISHKTKQSVLKFK